MNIMFEFHFTIIKENQKYLLGKGALDLMGPRASPLYQNFSCMALSYSPSLGLKFRIYTTTGAISVPTS